MAQHLDFRDVFDIGSQQLGCWGANTARIQHTGFNLSKLLCFFFPGLDANHKVMAVLFGALSSNPGLWRMVRSTQIMTFGALNSDRPLVLKIPIAIAILLMGLLL